MATPRNRSFAGWPLAEGPKLKIFKFKVVHYYYLHMYMNCLADEMSASERKTGLPDFHGTTYQNG
jgi:hypothetical protein